MVNLCNRLEAGSKEILIYIFFLFYNSFNTNKRFDFENKIVFDNYFFFFTFLFLLKCVYTHLCWTNPHRLRVNPQVKFSFQLKLLYTVDPLIFKNFFPNLQNLKRKPYIF